MGRVRWIKDAMPAVSRSTAPVEHDRIIQLTSKQVVQRKTGQHCLVSEIEELEVLVGFQETK